MKRVVSWLVAIGLAVVLQGCTDPHECKPGDIDRDHDGLCHER